MQNRLFPVTLAAAALIVVAGCSQFRFPGVYRIDIEQGNVVDEKMLSALKVGMTEAQVRYVMGSPQMADPFDPSRWLYHYRLQRGSGEIIDNKVVLWFENGTLARWEGKPLPPGTRYPQASAGSAATPGAEAAAPESDTQPEEPVAAD